MRWRRAHNVPTHTRQYVHIVSGDGPHLEYRGPDPKPKILHATTDKKGKTEIDKTQSLFENCAVPGPVVLIPVANAGVKHFAIEFTVENLSSSEATVQVFVGCKIDTTEVSSSDLIERVLNGIPLERISVPPRESTKVRTSLVASMDQLRSDASVGSRNSVHSPASSMSLSDSAESHVGIALYFKTPSVNGEEVHSCSVTAWKARENFHTSSNPQACTQVMHLLHLGDIVYKVDDVFGNDSSDDQDEDDDVDTDNDLCVICLSNPKNTALLPCRHFCFCRLCAQQLQAQQDPCPICRSDIKQAVARGND